MGQGSVAFIQLLCLLLLVGCGSLPQKPTSSKNPAVKRKVALTNPKKNRFISSNEKPSSPLKEHKEFQLARTSPQGALSEESLVKSLSKAPGAISLSEQEKVFFELAGENVEQLNDASLYKKIVEKYQNGDAVALEIYTNVLLKTFPRSIYCDNSLYMRGMLAFNQKKFGESLNAFQKILNDYPQSNKAVSALFGKGVVFKKMNLDKAAVRMLAQVINKYPGTPEASKAQAEIKLITQ